MRASVDRRRGTNVSPIQGRVCKILGQEDIKPHKVRYYLEWRDAEFEQKMAQVLCVYREVQVLKKAAAKSKKSAKSAAIVSYDEKPGIQVIATTAPDLPPVLNVHATFARDHEYKRHGTLSLLAGIDLLTGKVYALVRDRHRSREFIEFLKLLDAAYPASTAIKLILDNHSAHISREPEPGSTQDPAGRFDFTFTPKHGSWLNLIEGFFSKFARSLTRSACVLLDGIPPAFLQSARKDCFIHRVLAVVCLRPRLRTLSRPDTTAPPMQPRYRVPSADQMWSG